MNDLILDHTITKAEPLDFWPIQKKGFPASPACFELAYASGLLTLTHAAMPDWVMLTPEHIRIAVPEVANVPMFRKELAVDGVLHTAMIGLRCAAISDRGILAACRGVRRKMQSLVERPDSYGADQNDNKFDSPVMQPYDRWWYAVEHHESEIPDCKYKVLAIPASHVRRVEKRNPRPAIYDSYDLMVDGFSPVTAKFGIPTCDTDYAAKRSEWIETAVESLVTNIEQAVKRWPVLPGEPFQNIVWVENNMYLITVDTIDFVTVASPTASNRTLEKFAQEVHRVGRAHLARGLAMLRRAVVA